MEKFSNSKKKKILTAIVVLLVLLLLLLLAFIFLKNKKKFDTPTLKIETPQKISYENREPFEIDMTVSSLGDSIYPAASFSIDFDKSRLEFLGIDEGNLLVLDGENSAKLPEWSVNAEQCNKSGKINIMYLDTTAGKNAFSNELLQKKNNVVLRLCFRLRGSARAGDVYGVEFADAVFAADDEDNSLAQSKKTLKTINGRIAVGE